MPFSRHVTRHYKEGDQASLVRRKDSVPINVYLWGFPGGSMIKNLPASQVTWEMRIRSLGWKDPPEKGMATHSSILAWEISWTEGPGRLQSMGTQLSQTRLSN